jgi:hypothetical protein
MHTIAKPAELTGEESALLAAAAENRGRLNIEVRVETHGRAACTKVKKFFDPDDRSVAERYISAVCHLEQLRLVRQSGGRNAFELTNFGWLISRKLADCESESRNN